MDTTLQDYLNGLCCSTPLPPANYNFDVESSNWAGVGSGITDKNSFISFFSLGVGDFELVGNKIRAEILSDLSYINMPNCYITKINYISYNSSLGVPIQLLLTDNELTNFSPTALGAFSSLILDNNQLSVFNLPIGYEPSSFIGLNNNQLTNSSYTNMEAWANSLSVSTGKLIRFKNNVDSASGTNLQSILISKGWTVQV